MKVLLDDEIDLDVEPPVHSTIVYSPLGLDIYTASATLWRTGWRSTNVNGMALSWAEIRRDILNGKGQAIALFIPEEEDEGLA